MKGKISIITLLVADLQQSVSFYRDGLGFPPYNIKEGEEGIAFFYLEGTWLAFYSSERFAGTEGIGNAGSVHDAPRSTLAYNVKTKEEVDVEDAVLTLSEEDADLCVDEYIHLGKRDFSIMLAIVSSTCIVIGCR